MSIRIGDNVLNNGGTATFNGTSLTKIIYDGTTVWQKATPLCVTMLNEFSGQASSSIGSDGTTLNVTARTNPNRACIRLQSSAPMSDEREVRFTLYCCIALCTSAVLPDGTQAYLDTTSSPWNEWSSSTHFMSPNATCEDTGITAFPNTHACSQGKYEVCPEGTILPSGIDINYQLRIYDSATGVTCTVPWVCGCTVVLS